MRKVILVHGAWCSSEQLALLAVLLEQKGYVVFLIKLPGHGAKADPSGLGLDDYTQCVVKALEQVGPATLIGHSMGGRVAQKTAALRPDFVRALILLGSVPPRGMFFRGTVWRTMCNPYYWWPMFTGRRFRFRARDALGILVNRTTVPALELRKLGPESGRALRDMVFGQFADLGRFFRRSRIEKLPFPTLVVVGEYDRIMPRALQERIARRFGAPLCVISRAGHMLGDHGCASKTTEVICTFLDFQLGGAAYTSQVAE